VIQAGDLVAFDTDMVGPLGYLADISRSWVCPGKKPTGEQRRLYAIAEEQVLFNMSLIKPGLSFGDFAETCWPVPEEFLANRYMMMIHGVGLVDGYPSVAYARDFADWGYDGVLGVASRNAADVVHPSPIPAATDSARRLVIPALHPQLPRRGGSPRRARS
jgi:Xaa-Pro aminopeptidase